MKFKFKIQQYQTDAVEQTVSVFAGQPSKTNAQYRRDLGKRKGQITFEEEYVGWRNSDVELQGHQLLANIQQQQAIGNIPKSSKLSLPDGLGACSLDIEMETGTGKTYVYIKTMFELNKRYGWSKFIGRPLHGTVWQEGALLHLQQRQSDTDRLIQQRCQHQCDDYQCASIQHFLQRRSCQQGKPYHLFQA